MLELMVKEAEDGGVDTKLSVNGTADEIFRDTVIAVTTMVVNGLGDDSKNMGKVFEYIGTLGVQVAETIMNTPNEVQSKSTVVIDVPQVQKEPQYLKCDSCKNGKNRIMCAIADTCNYKPINEDITPEYANECDMCDRCVHNADRMICAIADTCNYKPIPAESEEE